MHRALAPGPEEHGHPADPAAPGAADGAPLRGRDPLAPRRAPAEPARPEAASSATSTAGSTGTPFTRTSTTDVVDVVGHRGDRRAHRPHGRVRRRATRERVTHRSHAIDYVQTQLDDQHVRASAAIPILFPPVRVEQPRDARGWYFDGGTRLNTPIKPALDLGAERLVVVATDSVAEPSSRPGRHDMRAARLRRRRAARAPGHARRPGRRGHADPRQHQHVLRRAQRHAARAARGRRAPRARRRRRSATARRAASRPTAASPTSSSRPRSGARSGAWRGGVPRPLRRPEGPALTRLPAAEPADRRREPDARRAAQLPLLRPRVHRGADPDGPARRPPLAEGRRRAPTTPGRSSRWTRSRAGDPLQPARVRRRVEGSAPRPRLRPGATDSSVRRRPSSSSTSASKPSSSRVRDGSSALRCTSPAAAGANSGSKLRRPFEHAALAARARAAASTSSSTEASSPRPTLNGAVTSLAGGDHAAPARRPPHILVARLAARRRTRSAGRRRAACRRRSRPRRPRRAGPAAGRRRCRSAG